MSAAANNDDKRIMTVIPYPATDKHKWRGPTAHKTFRVAPLLCCTAIST